MFSLMMRKHKHGRNQKEGFSYKKHVIFLFEVKRKGTKMELILKISQNDLSSVPYIFALKVLRLSSTVFHLLGKKKKKSFVL